MKNFLPPPLFHKMAHGKKMVNLSRGGKPVSTPCIFPFPLKGRISRIDYSLWGWIWSSQKAGIGSEIVLEEKVKMRLAEIYIFLIPS